MGPKREDDRIAAEYALSCKLRAVYELAAGAMSAPFLSVAEHAFGVPGSQERNVVAIEHDMRGGTLARIDVGGYYRFPDSFALRRSVEALATAMSLSPWERERVDRWLIDMRDRELQRDLAVGRELAPDARGEIERGELTLTP